MSSTVRAAKCDARQTRRATHVLFSTWIVASLTLPAIARAEPSQGEVVGWGSRVVGGDLSTGFVNVAAGCSHSLGLKYDGSIVAWGWNPCSQSNAPAPNNGFIAVAAGESLNIAIRRVMGDADGDGDVDWADFAVFADYLLGPSTKPQLTGWRFFDVDLDDDVDLPDFAIWQNAFTEP